MCGICGIFTVDTTSGQPQFAALERMSDLMIRRGPDDAGTWSDPAGRMQLGFRRLAILDLSPAGHQPMLTADERYVLVFNGEVYNFREMRSELAREGVRFRSQGDTEVVLYALANWGHRALERFNGMFALGFYDTVEKRLLLARDHAGIKPLYYMHTSERLVFASQYDQILAHPDSSNLGVSAEGLGLYLRLGYIPAPYAILNQTRMLSPGSWLEIDIEGKIREGDFFRFPVQTEPTLRGTDAIEAVDEAVTRAVKRQMVSDVPLGTFLSGGIDSPLVTAKMCAASDKPVHAFSIGTEDSISDESADALRYARELGVQHTLERFANEDALSMLEAVVSAYGEPFADYSAFPTLLVSRLARQHRTVMLSGDGGDELFWGYYGRFASVLKCADAFAAPHWQRSMQWGAKKLLGAKVSIFGYMQPSIGDWYRTKHTRIYEPWLKRIFPDMPPWPQSCTLYNYHGWQADETAQWLRWNEFTAYLPMVLMKVDRASMYHSLEVRVPLLDREVIAVAAQIDWQTCMDMEQGLGKMPLRNILSRHVKFQSTTKRGFTVPMGEWLRTSLRPVFEERVLSRQSIMGLPVHIKSLRKYYQLHLNNEAEYGWGLWVLLSLVLWEEHHFKRAAAVR